MAKNRLSAKEEAMFEAAETYGEALNLLWGETDMGRIGDDFLALFDRMVPEQRQYLFEMHGPDAQLREFMEKHGLFDEEPVRQRPKYLTMFVAMLAFLAGDPNLFRTDAEENEAPPATSSTFLGEEAPVVVPEGEPLTLEDATGGPYNLEERALGDIPPPMEIPSTPLVNDPFGSGELVQDDAELIQRMNEQFSQGKSDPPGDS
jgi:hypothetical protein